MHLVDGVPKQQIGQRLGMDVTTVRRAVAQATAPARRAVSRPRSLDRWRAQIEHWLRQDRRRTAKRLRRLLLPVAGPVSERTVRWYVARLKAAAAPTEVYVHRSPRPGVTLEVDVGASWAEVAGLPRKVTYVVATLVFRPRPTVASWAALNASILTELEADLATRRLADGRPVREAWMRERQHLRALPVHLPDTCRIEARVVDTCGHVRADRVT